MPPPRFGRSASCPARHGLAPSAPSAGPTLRTTSPVPVPLDPVPALRLVPLTGYPPSRRAPRERPAATRTSRGTTTASDGDVEVTIRVFAEGGSVTVMRRTALAPDGVTRHTVGIEAVIR